MKLMTANTPRRGAISGVLFATGVATGALGYLAAKHQWIAPAEFALIVAGLVALTSPIGWMAWFRLDEAAREAHKSSWMHGGSLGTILAAVLLAALVWSEAHHGWSPGLRSLSVAQALGLGAVILLVLQSIGYGLVWAGWWLSKR